MNREELLRRQQQGETLTQEELDFLAQTEPSNEPESQSQSTQPTPTPPASPTEDQRDRYISVLEATLRDNNRQLQELANRTAAPAPAAAPAPTAEELKQQFYNDPVTTTRSIVEEALSRTIAPLNDFVKGLRIEGSPYDRMLTKFKQDPRFAPALQDPAIGAAVEQIMGATELNELNMQSAIVHAIGLKSMGLLGTVTGTPSAPAPAPAATPAPTPSPSTVLPPHVRPSGPPAPRADSGNGKPARRPLTENERRLMREQGFKTEDEYWTWLELPASEVASADFDRPKPRT